MNILVCIKQVPDMESKFKVNSEGSWYDSVDLAWRMNEYDEYAVEQAVQLKEQTAGELTVLCIGPERVKETMTRASKRILSPLHLLLPSMPETNLMT